VAYSVPTSEPPSGLDLNCLLFGDDLKSVFQVKISSTEPVSALKKAIKEEKRPDFDHVSADALRLWKVSTFYLCVSQYG
jgi:hypothetical protein